MPEPGALYVIDREDVDFERPCFLTPSSAFFVASSKTNVLSQPRHSRKTDKRPESVPIRRLR
jgi:hypothetical protein